MGKSILFGAVCGLVFYPWLFIVLPLIMIFEPFRRIGHSLGYLNIPVMMLLGLSEIIVSYLICATVIYIIILCIGKKMRLI